MILKPKQICPYSVNCRYNKNGGFCQGINPSRNNSFECLYIDDNGKIIKEGKIRNPYDITGKMEFIQE